MEEKEKNEIIKISFNQQEILAIIKDNKPFVAIKPICENLGIDWEAQRKRINRDSVLSEGASMMEAPSNGGSQEMVCLPLEYLNGWLFGIDDSRVKSEIQEQLISYKKECYKTLHEYFFKGYSINKNAIDQNPEILTSLSDEIRKLRIENKDLYRKMTDAIKLTCSDYDQRNRQELNHYYSKIQDMIHFAVSKKVASQLVYDNVDSKKPLAGMTSFSGELKDVKEKDLTIGRNYMDKIAFRKFEILYDQLLSFVEMKALNNEVMTLEKWEYELRKVIEANGLNSFVTYRNSSRPKANQKAKEEWTKFKPIKLKVLTEIKKIK